MAKTASVNQLQPGEEDRFRALRLRSLRDAPDAFGTTLEVAAGWPVASWTRQLRTMPTFVAVRSGEDIGIVRGALDPDNPEQVWLISMWVAPTARDTGAGAALVAAVQDWARDTPASRLVLEVGAHNHPAQRLYQRMGFQDTGGRRRLPPPRDHIEECEMAYPLH